MAKSGAAVHSGNISIGGGNSGVPPTHNAGFHFVIAAGGTGLTPAQAALLADALQNIEFDPATGNLVGTDSQGDTVTTPIANVGGIPSATLPNATGLITVANNDGSTVVLDVENDPVTFAAATAVWDAL